jgi:membrane protease YdiL (CAAX protease family)
MAEDGGVAIVVQTLRRRPVAAYFVLTFAVSWTGAFLVVARYVLQGQPIPFLNRVLMFPAMLLGPPLAGVALTAATGGREGLRDLLRRMGRFRVPARWYAALLLPPCLVLLVLFPLRALVSPVFTPNRFVMGIGFGVVAGFFEEIGWMGFAFPAMSAGQSRLKAAVWLGLLWGAWHLPAIDHLGAASPHGDYWFPYFLAFTFAMTAMRVLIAWLYSNTGSVLLAQAMHAFSTSSLVVFSPRVSPVQEVLWYAVYGAVLWMVVAAVVSRSAGTLVSRQQRP